MSFSFDQTPGAPSSASTHSPESSASTACPEASEAARAFILAFSKNVTPVSSGSSVIPSSERLMMSYPVNILEISLTLFLLCVASTIVI
jgi:hypothetical protein